MIMLKYQPIVKFAIFINDQIQDHLLATEFKLQQWISMNLMEE